MKYISSQQLIINPDCGLKTRKWKETILALQNMIIATKQIRQILQEEKNIIH